MSRKAPRPSRLILVPAIVALATCLTLASQVRRTVDADLRNAAKSNGWLLHGHDYGEQRHSLLTQISASNVARLGPVWSYEVGPGGGNQWATPLFANGVLFGISNWSITFAVDARTGKELWRYDPQADRSTRLCCGVVSRGIALYEGKLIVPVIDGRIQALDASTGRLLWSSLAVPERKAREASPYSITMAPRVANGKVFIGNAGAEFTPFRGYVSALDVNNGKELWRFYTVPGDPSKPFENSAMAAAAKTWSGEWWKLGGGGSLWDGMAYDPDTNLLYVGTGNGLPYPQEIRHSAKGSSRLDNLYVASIIALDGVTGELKWHYQCSPGDQWDFDAVQHLMLADLRIDGRERKVIMQANKNGYFYVLDRTNGAFISGEPMAPVSWARGLDAKIYVPIAASGSFTYLAEDRFIPNPEGQDRGTVGPKVAASSASVATPPTYGPVRNVDGGVLSAWDPVTQRERWFGLGGVPGAGGVLSTATDLVFQTSAGRLLVYSADKGEKLLDFPIGQAGVGLPITYELDGKQYIALMGGTGRPNNPRLNVYSVNPAGQRCTRIVSHDISASPRLRGL